MSKLKDFLTDFVKKSKVTIVSLVNTELTNAAKKDVLDETIIDWVKVKLKSSKLNLVLRIVLEKLLLPNVTVITQVIYDLLKTRVRGVTTDYGD